MNDSIKTGPFVLMVLTISGGAVAVTYQWMMLGWCLIFAGFLGMVWVMADSLWIRRNDEIYHRTSLINARTSFAVTAAGLDAETRHFLAREWPEMGVEFGNSQTIYILENGVNTGVLLTFLQAFLWDSTEQHFVDVRHYNDDKSVQERFNVSRDVVRQQWRLATEMLEHWRYLQPNSMAGQSTWKWTTPEHFKLLRRRYLNVKDLVAE